MIRPLSQNPISKVICQLSSVQKYYNYISKSKKGYWVIQRVTIKFQNSTEISVDKN